MPLHTIDARIKYAAQPAFTKRGTIGLKMWVHYMPPEDPVDTYKRFQNEGNGSL
jgi:ribosomal protein S3